MTFENETAPTPSRIGYELPGGDAFARTLYGNGAPVALCFRRR